MTIDQDLDLLVAVHARAHAAELRTDYQLHDEADALLRVVLEAGTARELRAVFDERIALDGFPGMGPDEVVDFDGPDDRDVSTVTFAIAVVLVQATRTFDE